MSTAKKQADELVKQLAKAALLPQEKQQIVAYFSTNQGSLPQTLGNATPLLNQLKDLHLVATERAAVVQALQNAFKR